MGTTLNKIYLLSQKDIQYKDVEFLPIFEIKYIDFDIDFSSYDGLIFTSKNGIYSLQYNTKWQNIPSYAIATKTAKILKQYNSNVVYTGKSGHGDDFANELIDILQNKKVLYIRAKKVVSNLVNILNNNGVICDELISYETSCVYYDKIKQPPKGSVIVFTSPSTIKCFFNNFEWDSSYKAVSIGKTTAKYLPKNIVSYISNTTSIESCITLAKTLF